MTRLAARSRSFISGEYRQGQDGASAGPAVHAMEGQLACGVLDGRVIDWAA